jgi:hypothetical protein
MLLVIALGAIGFSYAWWTETLVIGPQVNTGEVDVIFWNNPNEPSWAAGHQWQWRVPNWRNYGWNGWTTRGWSLSPDQKTLTITLGNYHPVTDKTDRIAFGICNVGTIPAKLKSVTLTVSGPAMLIDYIRTQGSIQYWTKDGVKLWEKSFGGWSATTSTLPLTELDDKLTELLAGTVLYPGDFLVFGGEEEEEGCLGFALYKDAPNDVERMTISISLSFEFVQWNAP